MNPSPPPPPLPVSTPTPVLAFPGPLPPPSRRRFRWRYLFLGAGGLCLAFILALALSFRVGADTRALRRAALHSLPGEWQTQFELGAGRLPVYLAKAGLALVHPDLPPEARAGISAFQCAEVGIYRKVHSSFPSTATHESEPGGRDVLAPVREAMGDRGWEPVVQVRDGHDTVAVFMPKDGGSTRRLQACVLVIDRDDLVIVSGSVNPEPLVELAMEHAGPLCLARR